MTEGWVLFGKLGRPHGLRGELRLFLLHEASPHLDLLDAVRLEGEAGTLETRIVNLRRGTKSPLVRLDGIAGREDAERWVHAKLWVPTEVFPETDEGEFYGWELQGLEVVDAEGRRVGKVRALRDFGAGDLLEIRVRGRDVFVPFAEPYVLEVDIEAGRVVAEVDEWLDP